jgi:prolyl 4-hydroxylase
MVTVLLLVIIMIILIYVLVSWNKGGRGFALLSDEWEHPITVDSVLTKDECRYIIEKAESLFSPSTVLGVVGPSSTRTSETAWISKDDPIAQKILTKACEQTGKHIGHCENLQVVRYKPGTLYRDHHDSCCEGTSVCRAFEKNGGQRIGTLLVYLNDDFSDGETHFPEHDNMKVKVTPGSAIFFRPLGSNNKCHPKARHAGLPISAGVKYVCNAWVRENVRN